MLCNFWRAEAFASCSRIQRPQQESMANFRNNEQVESAYFNGYLFQRFQQQNALQYVNQGGPSNNQAGNYLQFVPDRTRQDAGNYLQFIPDQSERRPSSYLQFPPDQRRSGSPMPGPSVDREQTGSQESSDKSRRCSWSNTEIKCLIAAYRENYERLKTTKSSQGKKSVWNSIMEDFLGLCSDAGIDSEKNLTQVKEKWRAIFDKYKNVKDNNNKTGRDRKTFEFFDEMDEFLSGSDKVHPKFVKETRVNKAIDSEENSGEGETGGDSQEEYAVDDKARKKDEAGENSSTCPPKKKRKSKRSSMEDTEAAILELMEAQQEAITKADEKDERIFEALLKSQSDAQQRHQEFTLSVLGKLGDIFSSKK